ncbi:MAG: hypothetical protein JSW39_28050 [Desulfobacterales bacterium]|nr:MAG: hypothetical protein JSW39_28050 [Desulfobacterales bacterium]
MNPPKLRIFPPERLYADFNWQVWAVGWLAVCKAVLWLAYEPNLAESLLKLLGYKYTIGLLPLIVFGIGVWNLRKWAVWGIAAVAVADLIFFVTNPQTLNVFFISSEVRLFAYALTLVAFVVYGPLGDVLILLALPAIRKHLKMN